MKLNYIKYCNEPRFFLKIYNSISEEKQYEFETVFNECREKFNEKYDNKLFNPSISFKDCYIIIEQKPYLLTTIDLRDEMENKTIISEELLEDILQEFNTSHGLYVCDTPQELNKDYRYKIDHDEICDSIEQILN